MTEDASNGYEGVADIFIARRGTRPAVGDAIGATTVRAWAEAFPPGATVLDLGSGPGEPVTRVLRDAGLTTYAVDASPKVIGKVGRALKPGGRFLFTAHKQPLEWLDAMTGRRSQSLGALTSAFGVGETHRDVPLVPRFFIRLLLQDVYRDKSAGEAQLIDSELDWTLVCPTALVDGAATGRYRVGERLSLRGFPRIARADVAAFLLAQIDDTTYMRRRVLISS